MPIQEDVDDFWLDRGQSIPAHRNPNKQRTVSILKSTISWSFFIEENAHQWGQRYYDGGSSSDSESGEGKPRQQLSDKTYTQTNFFECR